jgi:predicted acylesterase/phospholipase RssA
MTKVGFCFTGEGARGSVQAGIAHDLSKKGINADFTIGISSGSICAASYAYLGPEGLANMWKNISNIFDVFQPNINFLFSTGIFNQRPMEKIVKKSLENEPLCESVVCRMNIETGELQYVSNKHCTKEEFKEAILGSVAITGLVQDRNGWVDAGSRQLAPLEQCIEAGCDEIYVIMGRPAFLEPWEKPKGFLKALNMAFRALDISLYEIMIRDIFSCIREENDPKFKNVNIHLVEPNNLAFDSVYFNLCKVGVEYGRNNYYIHDKKGIRLFLKGP